jgi:DNA-binding MarR family transcriptional regulator
MTGLRLDPYVVDTLMADLVDHDRSAASFLVYLWLWAECARVAGRRKQVERSLREIAEGTGVSKRAVQSALARLKRRKLVAATRTSITATPVYVVLTPWRR